jgi:uncharacterized protein YacL
MKKKLLIVVLVIVAIFFASYSYLYKSHRNVSSEEAAFSLTSSKIFEDYKKDEKASNKKYLDKSIVVSGKITNIDIKNKTIVLDNKLFGLCNSTLPNLKINDSISLKGRFMGYDELLEEMKMDQITINK